MDAVKARVDKIDDLLLRVILSDATQLAGMQQYMGWFRKDKGVGMWMSVWQLDLAEKAMVWLRRRAKRRIITWHDVDEALRIRGCMATTWWTADFVSQFAASRPTEWDRNAWNGKLRLLQTCRPGIDMLMCREYSHNNGVLFKTNIISDSLLDMPPIPDTRALSLPDEDHPLQPIIDAIRQGNANAAACILSVRRVMEEEGSPPSGRPSSDVLAWCEYMLGSTKQYGHKCVACVQPATARCGGCMIVRYCGKKCQIRDWPEHKDLCPVMKSIGLVAREVLHNDESEKSPVN